MAAAGGVASPAAGDAAPASPALQTLRHSLDGGWRFRLDAEATWRTVTVPHTWQTSAATAAHYGVAWYEREFTAPAAWADLAVRIEFEAVFHSATVWVNDQPAGEHLRKGYTAFALDIGRLLRFGAANQVRVRVDNTFDDRMLPRGRSSDWAHDGGIYRPVRLLVTPRVYLERVEIETIVDPAGPAARVGGRAVIRNVGPGAASGSIAVFLTSEDGGPAAAEKTDAGQYALAPGQTAAIPLAPIEVRPARLWHFDHPHLYRFCAGLTSGHWHEETFGLRQIEVRGAAFYLNGERVRLMGVERMAGSHPEFGMAEPSAWIEHDHADMKELNCAYTRVHWPQDRRILDYCDRQGILIQTEVPSWGGQTFQGMEVEPSPDIMQNGLEQLREMIARDRNHPCIFSWGLCNEIGGQNPPAQAFARRMYAEAKRLDPQRLATYASNSLQQTPDRDVAGLMDYIMWNEYYESWFKGGLDELAKNLDEIHRAFPDKPVVISEYGYCACTAERPEGDTRRIEILREHNRLFRERDWIAGLIFFCYNDYRTHIGDRGLGPLQQRVHGVVDLYGNRKASFSVLREESSPIEWLRVRGSPGAFTVTLRNRASVPAHRLEGYQLRSVLYGYGGIPLERQMAVLPGLDPGQETQVTVVFQDRAPWRVQFDVLRPTGFSAAEYIWRP